MTEIDILKNRAGHLRRPPDWRWQLAGYLHDRPTFVGPEIEDEGVIKAMLIQNAYRDHQSSEELAEMLRSGGPYIDAYTFWQETSLGLASQPAPPDDKAEFKPLVSHAIDKAELEGMILTGKPIDEICEYAPLKGETLRCYEELFFDVRDRLKLSTWISNTVIGPLHQSSPFAAIPNLIRAYGYQSKSLTVVRQVAETFSAAVLAKIAVEEEPDRYFDEDFRSNGSMKAALASRMRPFNRYTYEKIMDVHNETREIDFKLRTGQGIKDEAELREAVRIFHKQLDIGYGEEPTNFADFRTMSGPRLLAAGDDNGA